MLFRSLDPFDMGWLPDRENSPGLSASLKEYAEELICPMKKGENSLAESYALAFLSDVNWHEIAENMIEAYSDDEAA